MPTTPERLSKIEGAVERIGETVDRIDLSLRGNGVTGIQTRLDRLEQSRSGMAMWLARIWQIAMAGAILWLTLNLSGCDPLRSMFRPGAPEVIVHETEPVPPTLKPPLTTRKSATRPAQGDITPPKTPDTPDNPAGAVTGPQDAPDPIHGLLKLGAAFFPPVGVAGYLWKNRKTIAKGAERITGDLVSSFDYVLGELAKLDLTDKDMKTVDVEAVARAALKEFAQTPETEAAVNKAQGKPLPPPPKQT